MCAAVDHPVAHDGAYVPAGGVEDLLATDTTNMGARGAEQVIAATLQRPSVLRIRIVQTTIVGATTGIYAVRSVFERAHDRMHAVLGAHKTNPQVPIRFERLRWKIARAP